MRHHVSTEQQHTTNHNRTHSVRQYTSVEKSWFRKYVRHVPYCIVILFVGVCGNRRRQPMQRETGLPYVRR